MRYCEASNSGQVPPSEARGPHTLYGSISLRSVGANRTNTSSENMKKGRVGLSADGYARGLRSSPC